MAQTREDSTTEDDAGVLKENGCGLRNEYVPFSLWFLSRRSLTDISSFFINFEIDRRVRFRSTRFKLFYG